MDSYRGDVTALAVWAQREYEDALASRLTYDNLINTWTRQYEQIPIAPEREIPWKGASNLEVGEAASHVDAVYSRIEEAWFQTTPTAKFEYFDPRYKDGVIALQDFVNQVTLPNANYRLTVPHVLLGMTKLGTSFQWCSFEEEYVSYYRDRRKASKIVHVGPSHRYVSTRNTIVPPDARDTESARWIAVRNYYTWGQIEHYRNTGYFTNTDAIRAKGRVIDLAGAKEGERESGIRRTGSLLQWEIVQMFCRYYDERERELQEIWLTFDYPSMEILAAHYPPYSHMQRPVTKYTYMIREGAFYGLGIVGMMSMIQQEITDIHNYTIDNMLWSMTGMVAGPRNMMEQITIHPGAYWPKSSPNNRDEYQFFTAGSSAPYPAQAEASSRAIGERRTGISDSSMQQGAMPGLSSSRTPVGTAQLFLGESNRRFALSIALGKEAEKQLLYQHVMLIKQFWSKMRPLASQWNSQKSRAIEALMNLSDDSFTNAVTAELSMSTAALNKDIERANLGVITQIYQAYVASVVQLKQMLMQFPQLEPEITKAISGGNELLSRLLAAYDIRNPEEFLIGDANATANGSPDISNITDESISAFLNTGEGGAAGLVSGGPNGQLTRTPVESDLLR